MARDMGLLEKGDSVSLKEQLSAVAQTQTKLLF